MSFKYSSIIIVIFLLFSCEEKYNRNNEYNLSKKEDQKTLLAIETSQEYADFLLEFDKLLIEYAENPSESLKQKIKQMEEEAEIKFPDYISTGEELEGKTESIQK